MSERYYHHSYIVRIEEPTRALSCWQTASADPLCIHIVALRGSDGSAMDREKYSNRRTPLFR